MSFPTVPGNLLALLGIMLLVVTAGIVPLRRVVAVRSR